MQAAVLYRHRGIDFGYRRCMTTMGQRVRALRKTAGMTQVKLSAVSGIAQSAISDIENDIIKNPGADIMSRLCRALRTNQQWLFTGLGQSGPTDSANGFDEVEALQLVRQMDESHRQSWLVAGRTLLTHQVGHQTNHEPYKPPLLPAPAKKAKPKQ